MLDLLASKGASLAVNTRTGATLAHIAACDGASGCLRVLCDHKHASVDAMNQAGNTPVMFAAMVGDLEVLAEPRRSRLATRSSFILFHVSPWYRL